MVDAKQFVVGLGISGAASGIWQVIPTSNQYKLSLAQSPLAFIEHYHWGLGSLIVAQYVKTGKSLLDGFGGGLIVIEAGNSQPFGYGKPTFGLSTSLGMFMTAIFLASYAVNS